MLLQSNFNEIYLLPALPSAWKEGEIKGLKARGNFEVSIAWKDHALTTAAITSYSGGICKVRSAAPFKIKGINKKSEKTNNGYTLSFKSEKGKSYYVSAE